ncbi:MAG: peptidoglycan-binding protein, partial [Patescibacteria group bacterium]
SGEYYGQRYNSSGSPQWTLGGTAAIASTTGAKPSFLEIMTDGSGGAFLVWQDSRSNNFNIYAQRINGSGAPQWTSGGIVIASTTNSQNLPVLTTDGSGGAIITWDDERAGANSGDVYAQRVNSSGVVQWAENGIAVSTATSEQNAPKIISDDAGGAIIAWTDKRSSVNAIFAQRLNGSGSAQWLANGVPVSNADAGAFGAFFTFLTTQMATDGSGGAIMAWLDTRVDDSTNNVYAQRVSANAPLVVAYPDSYYGNVSTSSSAVDWSTHTLTAESTQAADQTITFHTRLLFTDEFDDGSTANLSKHSGDTIGTITETGGILTLENIPTTSGSAWYTIDTGQTANYYPASSTVRARVRVRSSSAPYFALITDNWSGSQAELATANTWTTLSYHETVAFTDISVYIDDNPAIDGVDIDWVQIEPPLSFDDWDALSGSAIQTGSGYALQYRATLSSTDYLSTPTLSGVTLAGTVGGGGDGGGSSGGGSGSTPDCSDNFDNDGDGLIDLADPGCADSKDNNEVQTTNAITPVLAPAASSTLPAFDALQMMFPRTLSLYSIGWDVALLQHVLRFFGHFTYPDTTNYFGSLTKAAVTAFQRAHNIDPIGIAGPLTRAALEEKFYERVAFGCTFPVAEIKNLAVPESVAGEGGFARTSFENGLVSTMAGSIKLPGGASDSVLERAETFLETYRNLFGIESIRDDLKMVDYVDEDTGSEPTSADAPTHILFERMISGLPVFGSSIIVKISSSTIDSIQAALPQTAALENGFVMSESDVSEIARKNTTATVADISPLVFTPSLVYDCQSGNRAAYKVTLIGGTPEDPTVRIIDAQNGTILYEAFPIRELQNFSTVYFRGYTEPILVKQDQPAYTNPNANLYPDALKLYDLASAAYNYFLKTFRRDSYDGKGGRVELRMYPPLTLPQAGFNEKKITDGHAELLVFGEKTLLQPVITHEYTHGVISSSGVLHGPTNSIAGAIDEGLADLFAFWQSGIYKMIVPGLRTRDAAQPTHVSEFRNLEHDDSTIISHAAYTAARGGYDNVSGITIPAAKDEVVSQVFYKTIADRNLIGTPNFKRLRDAVVTVARNAAKRGASLRGEKVSYQNCSSLLNGFAKVGIGEADKDFDCWANSEDNCPDNYNPEQKYICGDPSTSPDAAAALGYPTSHSEVKYFDGCFFVAIGGALEYKCGTGPDNSLFAQYLCVNNPLNPDCITSGKMLIEEIYTVLGFYDHFEFITGYKREFYECKGKYCSILSSPPWTVNRTTTRIVP